MRKIPCHPKIGSSLLMAFFVIFLLSLQVAYAETYNYTIEAGNYKIEDVGEGYQLINMEGFGYLLDPGKPKLPSQIFSIALPPGATIDSVETRGLEPITLEGTYNIQPAPMVSLLSAGENQLEEDRSAYAEVLQSAYASKEPYPDVPGIFKQQGAYRKYILALVRYSPFSYIPDSGQLTFYPGLEVTVSYSYSRLAEPQVEGLLQEFLPEAEERAAGFIVNYSEAQPWYPADTQRVRATTGGFVIITTNALEDAVWPIRNWETCKGRDVHVATVEDIDAAFSGVDRAERIRNYLRTYLGTWSIAKVMLIGDITDVPMRYTYPAGSDGPDDDTTSWEIEDRVPTDYYYAELSLPDSTSWNSNTSGIDYYMYGHQGYDNVQFPSEVDVGRIPWSDPALVEDICLKMVEFEYSTDMTYKLNYLLTGAYFWDDTDNAVLKTYIINNALDPGNPPTRIYEQDSSCWNSIYYSEYAMNRTITRQVWGGTGDGPFGFVNLAGHGSSFGGVYFKERHPTCAPEVYFYGAADCPYLDDSHPAIVFSNACSTGWPENSNNLGKKLLERGGVAVVASNRVAFGAHGWNDPSDGNCSTLDWLFTDYAARTDGSRSSVGWSMQAALSQMYSYYNWDNSWWQFFEWNLYGNPDLWLNNRPSALPNLEDVTLSGWSYPLVPRSTDNATATWCPVTSTLSGNSSNTWFNWAWTNSGTYNAPKHRTTVYLDDGWRFYSEPLLAAGSDFKHQNLKTNLNITGGRHTVYYHIDDNDQVWETSENDNCWGRQFVWSPYGLADNTPVTRSTPPDASAWGCASGGAYYNNDGFAFYLQSSHPNKYWSAVGILPYYATADYDLRLWDIGDYTGSGGGFGSGYLEYSQWGAGSSDFVIVNNNTATSGMYYAGVLNRLDGTGNYNIEEATSTKIYPGSNGPYTMAGTGVLDIYETNETSVSGLSAGEWGFKLVQTAGTCDLGMSLYDDETVHASKSEYMSGGYANSGGNGGSEFMKVTIPDSGWHGLAVWKVDASDFGKSSTYTIKMGKCGTPASPSGPSPAAGATGVSVNADLNWGDCTGTEYYEVWFREASGSWQFLGSTESSAWALGTLNEQTNYYWQIKAVNICGSYVWSPLWSFTTEDKTAPTPNPMTWATEPYELNTSQIRMVASTASDPTAPVSYFFDFYSSPTGGSGGTDSALITATTYTDSGLGINHQYGYRVRARDAVGNYTGYSSVSYDYTDIETPTGITFGTITAVSIQARSSNTPSGLTRGSSGLYVQNTTAGTGSGWKQDNGYWTSAALSPNTSYTFHVRARNGDADPTPWSPTASRYTLANAPAPTAFSNITTTSIRANWTANGNPAGTQYYCQNTTAGTNSGWTTATNWNSSGLGPGIAYSFRVKARNGDGTETGWVSLGSAETLQDVDLCECDLNADHSCNILDYQIFIQDWGADNCNDPGVTCECDLNGDGSCNILDYQIFIQDWGRSDCP
jgi:hypothetical protein